MVSSSETKMRPAVAPPEIGSTPRRFDLSPTQGEIRPARETDLLDLEWHGGADLRGFYREAWDNHNAGAITMLVADFNDFPIGLALIYWRGKTNHPHIPDLQSLRVMPLFRGMGIGSFLLREVEEQVRASGHEQVSLSVGVDNPRARTLYERQEYCSLGESYQFSWHYQNAAGREIQVEETVTDMIKNLKGEN